MIFEHSTLVLCSGKTISEWVTLVHTKDSFWRDCVFSVEFRSVVDVPPMTMFWNSSTVKQHCRERFFFSFFCFRGGWQVRQGSFHFFHFLKSRIIPFKNLIGLRQAGWMYGRASSWMCGQSWLSRKILVFSRTTKFSSPCFAFGKLITSHFWQDLFF